MQFKNEKIGIYIHVPFCRRKCVYCDFYSIALPDREIPNGYTEALCNELVASAELLQGKTVDTVYFGGGTPSLLSPRQLEKVMSAIGASLSLCSDAEITIEANPDSVTPQKLLGYRKAGVNRISFGIQSACDKELSALSRLHDFSSASRAVSDAASAGFENISADLMIGTPYQTKEALASSIDALALLPLTHISAYMLKVEEGTPLCNSELLKSCMSEDETADCYVDAVKRLFAHGFHQYEISNFCKPSYESRHNMKYWRCEEYLGLGPSAHSFIGKTRFSNPPSLEKYLTGQESEKIISDTNAGGEDEQVLLGLRLSRGIPISLLQSIWGERAAELSGLFEKLSKKGLVHISDGRIACTTAGFLVSNTIICLLLGQL